MSFFEVCLYQPKTSTNVGTLFRTAYQLGCSGLHVIGHRYKHQSSDTYKSIWKIPLRQYETFDAFYEALPYDTMLIGVEMDNIPLSDFKHPQCGIYIFGAEDYGLPKTVLEKCHKKVSLSSIREPSYNLAVSGAIVLYHRIYGL